MCAVLKDLKFFEQSGLDQDSAIPFVAKNDYIGAWNIRVTGTQPGEAGYISSIESNEPLTPNISPSIGLSKAIGLSTFETIRAGIGIVYDSAGFHQIIKIDYDTNTQSLLYTDKVNSASGLQLLNLDPNFYMQIKLINDIYPLWSDGQSSIGFTNLNTLQSGGYGQVLAEDFSLIKPQCLPPITAVYTSDPGKASNFFKQKLFQYTVQYISYEFTYSAWATWSKRIIPVSEATPAVGTDVTVNNAQVVSVNIGSIRVKTLNIASRFGTFDFNIIKQVDTVYILALPHTSVDISNQIYEAYDPATNIYSFVFYNESLNIPVAPTEIDLPYDAVPLAATAIEKINGNIIALGDLTTGYARPTTIVQVDAVGYDPNVTVPVITSSQLQIAGTNPGSSGSGQGNHKRLMEVDFSGIAHTGDVMTIIIADIRNAGATNIFSYTVPSGQDGDTLAAVSSFAPIIPNSNFINFGGGFYGIQFVGPSYYGLQNAYVTIAYSGAPFSKSVHAFLDNSSYQAALSYRDAYGRYFPLETDNTFIFNTPSYAQLLGLTPAMQWKINTLTAPADAVDYQWLVTKNNTTLSVLDVLANLLDYKGTWDAHGNSPDLAAGIGTVGDAYQISVPSIPTDDRNLGNGIQEFNTGDYVVYNGQSWDIVSKNFADIASGNVLVFKINPLNLFNQLYSNAGVNTVLTYGFTNGDTCTLSYYIDSSVITYINNPCVQLSVLGYDGSTFLVKTEKSGTFNSSTIAGKDVLIRLSTPNTQQTNVITETAWFEIGERFTITNGLHDTLSGTITDGDVYFKSRQYQGAVDPNTAYSVAVTDFNFSDFYPSAFPSYGRPRAYNDELERTERKASIITSQNYILGSKNNGLTKFYPSNIYGDADGQTSSSFGAIRILWQRNDILIAIQQLHVAYIPVNISIVEDQIQQKQYAISEKLLNNVRYSDAGNIGIGDVKESFCFYNNNGFFIDPNRSEPIKLAINGVEPIAGKMSKFFKAQLQLAVSKGYKIVGYYDTFYNEYVVSIQLAGNTLLSLPFNVLNWNPFDSYTLSPSDISISINPSHATASGYNLITGDIFIVPNANYVGNDTMQISFPTPGGTVTKNACYNWTAGSDAVNQFAFAAKINQLLSTDIQSNTILVSGNTIAAAISITGDTGKMYSVNGGAFTASPGTVNNGDTVKVEVTSSASNSTLTSCTLTIDGQSATFNVTTEAGGGGNNFFINNNSSATIDFVSYSGPDTGVYPSVAPSDFLYNVVTGGTYNISVKVSSPGAYVDVNGTQVFIVGGTSTAFTSVATPIFVTATDTP